MESFKVIVSLAVLIACVSAHPLEPENSSPPSMVSLPPATMEHSDSHGETPAEPNSSESARAKKHAIVYEAFPYTYPAAYPVVSSYSYQYARAYPTFPYAYSAAYYPYSYMYGGPAYIV